MTNILDTSGRLELMVRKRLSRQEKKAETRARLLEAAESVFARRGFHAASVEEVAEEAGFSTGAVYSNFGGKEDLFLALWDSALEGALRVVDETFGSERRPFEERLREASEYSESKLFGEGRTEPFLLFVEFWAQAVRDPDLRPALAARQEKMRERAAELIEAFCRERGVSPPADPSRLASAIIAIRDGLVMQRLVDSEAVPEGTLGAVLEIFFRGIAARDR
jgi:AcrR family transcriptional regulator